MTHNAAFYFANLGADVARCVHAAKNCDESRYHESILRAHRTLEQLHKTKRYEAYEEALLMLRCLSLSKTTPETLSSFQSSLDSLIATFPMRLTI
ncbi:MAG: hypothetical protein NTU85_01150 [Candidatus Kaiserbacteria bacterium]|nr:hypothetical protein [Candidatus Kaiserbacteria bacterium]